MPTIWKKGVCVIISRAAISLWLIFGLLSCAKHDSIWLENSQQQAIAFDSLAAQGVTLWFFMSPECPLSENYTAHVERLKQLYGEKISVNVVVPGHYDTWTAIQAFRARYGLSVAVYRDSSWAMTRHYQAKITPEVLVLADKKPIYQGAIDNWAISLGKQRQKASEHYLDDVLTAYFAGRWKGYTNIPAVGCFIELPQ